MLAVFYGKRENTMIPEDIQQIILKYNKEICNEISSINLAIERIKDSFKVINDVISSDLFSYMRSNEVFDKEKENQLLQDAQRIREFMTSINGINEKHIEKDLKITKKVYKKLSIQNIIVLKTIKQCSHDNHQIEDVIAKIPVLYDTCKVHFLDVELSYCKTCDQYYMLKSDFDKITGIILCQVIDQTSVGNVNQNDDFSKLQSQSILFKCGYTVSSQRNLPVEARRIILCSVIESHLMTKAEIKDHLNILIERGRKIPSWKEATKRWEYDKKFIDEYDWRNVPQVVYDKIVLKYSK